ncbi:dUTP diphosphatase [Candidatus Woesearchaeota archaeon]|jgi:dUTP pyrophosphatase|nr:dUTP diphosphatase [Candidatus Woesearchaeota archaeon]MBT3537306.1 dUTP diphosphatase [Candidatus Woesearchaeota archaeon]MBT4696745.1 dUTP diphosphatase [Candidatus Woesearchaeota archaeon]MBT4716728.1 dUTP diphosphatase [Candidatus Woesearchaeota archaeon]MBT7106384.1 dUTP diphosphatase [Candidatus Woesearchaeota archaeon]
MEKVEMKIKKLRDDAIVPRHALVGDVAVDLHSVEDVVIAPGDRKLIGTGLSIAFPIGYAALVWDRSGMAKLGLKTMGGVIDPTYRGEYKIFILNTTKEDYSVSKGDRIAQLLVQKVYSPQIEVVEDLDDTERGKGGFGHTGR